MKEMCRNFIYSKHCSRTSDSALIQPTSLSSLPSDTPTDSCKNCVMERIGPAQAFIPSQPYTSPTEQEQSLICGTTFSDLVIPYCSGWNLYRFRKEA